VAGNPKTREVFALKRVTFLEHLKSNLVLPKHLKPESEVKSWSIESFKRLLHCPDPLQGPLGEW
jgi:hypothetical protein